MAGWLGTGCLQLCWGTMRGVVLLVDTARTGIVDIEDLRAKGLTVHEMSDVACAFERLAELVPDVIVTVLSSNENPSYVSELRHRIDYATSILVLGTSEEQSETATHAGGDAFVPPSADLSYEIHRALI